MGQIFVAMLAGVCSKEAGQLCIYHLPNALLLDVIGVGTFMFKHSLFINH